LRPFRAFAPFTIVLSLAACGGGQRPPATAPGYVPPAAWPPSGRGAVSATDFVARNGSIDLFVIRSSELALQRSASPRVRDFATTMIEGHKGTSAQLSLAGRRLNLLPSATMMAREQAMLDALQTSGRFDADYVHDQRLVHQEAIALDSGYAANGASPTLRPVAKAALPIEQRHLRLLAYL
jgi:putative membrane protein